MASTSVADDQVWEKTSTPNVVRFKRDEKYRLRLNYTPCKSKTPTRITSQQQFETEDEARASALSWRLSWEQGQRGALSSQGASQETLDGDLSRSSSSTVPLQGEFKVLQDLPRVELRIFVAASRSNPRQCRASHDCCSFALPESTPGTMKNDCHTMTNISAISRLLNPSSW